MMGGDFGSQAGALLMIPVLLVVLGIGVAIGGGLFWLGWWILSLFA
jgi:hypothetical protein